MLHSQCNRVKGSVISDRKTATCSSHFTACVLSPGHIRHPSGVRSVCGLFAVENRGDRSIALWVPQGVCLNPRGREVQNQWSWTIQRFANMFANQSAVHVHPTDIY